MIPGILDGGTWGRFDKENNKFYPMTKEELAEWLIIIESVTKEIETRYQKRKTGMYKFFQKACETMEKNFIDKFGYRPYFQSC